MKKIMMLLALMPVIGFIDTGVINANNDYVCSYYTTSCNCTWETDWRSDGTKHCIGTRDSGTRYGNTRVGCPGSTAVTTDGGKIIGGPLGSVPYQIYGGFKYGDLDTAVTSCELVAYDNIAPIASATLKPNLDNVSQKLKTIDITPNKLPLNTYDDFRGGAEGIRIAESIKEICKMDGKEPFDNKEIEGVNYACTSSLPAKMDYRNNGNWNQTDSPIGQGWCKETALDWVSCKGTNADSYILTPSCTDNESGCKPVPSPIVMEFDSSRNFSVFDLAGNFATCKADTSGSGSISGCVGTVVTAGTTADGGTCKLANGNPCSSDQIKPTGKITYSPQFCINSDVEVKNTCMNDNPGGSGCRSGDGEHDTISVGSNQNGTLGIADNAGNIDNLPWSINWIDKSMPHDLNFYSAPQKAGSSNVFVVSAKDEGVAGCSDSNIGYKIVVEGPQNLIKSGNLPKDGSSASGILGLEKAGKYKVTLTVTDQAGNVSTKVFNDAITINPSTADESRSSISLVGTPGSKYANAADKYSYKLTLRDSYGNLIKNKKVSSINQENKIGYTGFKTLKTNMITNNGSDALIESDYSTPTSAAGETAFSIISISPGEFSDTFAVVMPTWGDDYADIPGQSNTLHISSDSLNSFKKPIVADLSVEDGELSIGTLEQLDFIGTKKTALNNTSPIILNNLEKIRLSDPVNFSIEKTGLVKANLKSSIDTKINIIKTKSSLSLTFSDSELPYVTYGLGGHMVSYRLSSADDNYYPTSANFGLDFTDVSFRGLNVTGNTQAQGNQGISNDMSNFSDLSKLTQRTLIKQSAYKIIAGRSPDDTKTVGGVKYVNGTKRLSELGSGYETLILKNGNLIIDKNILTPLGIIVLRDDQSKSDQGNIYVNSSVRYINAIIYGDGGLISSNTIGVPYNSDSTARTKELDRQLVIKGSLFTRNTIGGALAVGDYILPGGSKTTNFNEAMKYDLNYIRRNNKGYNVNGINGSKDYNLGRTGNLEIFIDQKLHSNPPKGFNN